LFVCANSSTLNISPRPPFNIMSSNHEDRESEHRKHDEKVQILINGKPFDVSAGKHSVAELKQLASIPKEDILCEVEGGQLRPLKDHEEINVKAGEKFVSHVPGGQSS
jgi:multiubiquitin